MRDHRKRHSQRSTKWIDPSRRRQRPFKMGYNAPSVMIDLIEGKKVDDPIFTCIQK
jgi:hypothetical protein